MEQHPVPRNISSFQFRLIGDMTIRQFLYLLAGGGLGYLFLKFPLPSFLKLPLSFFSFISGAAFAFVPMQERPLDNWLKSFIKSIYSPTQFIWKKEEEIPEILTRLVTSSSKTVQKPQHLAQFHESRQKLQEYLKTLPQKPTKVLDKQEIIHLKRALSFFEESRVLEPRLQPVAPSISPPPKTEPPPIHLPPKKIIKKEAEEKKEEEKISLFKEKTVDLSKKVEDLKRELEKETVSKERFLELHQSLAETLKEQERLTKELINLRKTLETKRGERVVHPRMVEVEETPRVKMVAPKFASKIGLPKVPDIENLISGVVKAAEGELLPSVIITIKDEKGMPVRALKTNRLGQFAVSTPLKSGTYTIEVLDLQHRLKFDIIEVNLTDKVFPPLEIMAKSEKELIKERLAKELFKNTF